MGFFNSAGPLGRYGLVAAVLFSAAGCGAASSNPSSAKAKQAIDHQNDENAPPILTVANQSSNGYSIRVAVVRMPDGSKAEGSGVTRDAGGFVALASDVKDKPAGVLGYASVKEGTSHNVLVHSESKLTSGRYFVLLDPPGSSPAVVADSACQKRSW